MQQHADIVTDLKGNVVRAAQVRVLLLDGTLATIYAANGGAPTGNPLTSGQKGEFAFYAPNGDYTLEISVEGKVFATIGPIKLYDALEDTDRASWSSLAADDGAEKVGNGGESVKDSLAALQLADYEALRAYSGLRKSVYITGYLVSAAPSGIAGMFVRDDSDTTSTDNGGTVIVAANGKRWKRSYSGPLDAGWFGVNPNNASNAAALQAAVNAKKENQDILISGVIRTDGQLNITTPTSFVGTDARNANLPNYDTSSSHLIFTGAGSSGGIVGNANLSLRNLVVTSAADYCVSLTDASLLTENVVIQGSTSQGVRIVRGYYNKFTNTRIEYCGSLGAYFDNCYNISAAGLSVRNCPAGLFLTNGSTMTMMAGSIEDFNTSGYGVALQVGSAINFFGTYFEGNPAGGGSYGVSLGTNCAVNALGCKVYLSTMARWITPETAASLGVRVVSRGNTMVWPEDSFAVEAYNLLNTDATGFCDIAGDNWLSTAGANAKYVGTVFTGGTGPLQNVGSYSIQYPPGHPLFGKNINTRPLCANVSNTTPSAPLPGTIVNFGNNGTAGDDPLSLHTGSWGYNSYQAVFQKGQWEKVGIRLPNQADIATADATDLPTAIALVNALKTAFNARLAKDRAAGVMG